MDIDTLAAQIVPAKPLEANFAIYGRGFPHTSPDGPPSGFSVRPYFPAGESHTDWSWRPDPEVKEAIARGNRKCSQQAIDRHLATLAQAERIRILLAKKEYENTFFAKIEPLERTFKDQMEGWKDDNA